MATPMQSIVNTIAARIQCNIRETDDVLVSLIFHGYSSFFTSAGVIALGCLVSPAAPGERSRIDCRTSGRAPDRRRRHTRR